MHPPKLWSRLAATAAGILLALPLASPGLAAPGADSLDDAVTSRLLDRAEQLADFAEARSEDTKVEITRTRGGWAFGTAVLLALAEEDAYPEGWLFLARRQGDSWAVAFDGEDRFAALAGRAPLLSAEERKTFAGSEDEVTPSYYNGDYRTGMRLPFAVGQSWYLTGGPHGSSWNSIDMAGGDQVVRAARHGTAYTMCRGWIRVVHDRGYSTDYYHLWSNINVNGAWVGAGAYLGYTGTDVTCGGSATGRHVHFSLRQNGNNVPIAHHIIGKWTPYNGSAAYQGYALHGSRRVNVGGALYNYGALGFNQGIVDTNGGTVLNKRSGPGTGYSVVGSVSDGATVTISCSRNGTWHTGRFGSTNLWNRLTDGTWISDAYLATGSNGPVSGWC